MRDQQVANKIHHVVDGEKALDYLFVRGGYSNPIQNPRPNLILLDLRLPRIDGLEVLKTIKTTPTLLRIPVVILTSSDAESDIAKSYDYHANSYVVKPLDFKSFTKLDEGPRVLLAWLECKTAGGLDTGTGMSMDSGTGTKTSHILLLEDDRAHQDLVLRAFRDNPGPFRVTIAGTLSLARQVLECDPPDLIIADWILPDGKGLDILPRRDGKVMVPLVIMTSHGDEHLAVEIMKSGAIDYVVKSATVFKDLPHIARRALREWENIRQRIRAEEIVQESQKRLADIISFLPDAVLAIDNDGRVIAWNNGIERMTGVAAKDMLGKGDHEYSIPFYGERRPILIDLVLMEDGEVEKKYDEIRRDGDRITSETFIQTLFGGKGAYLWGTATPLNDTMGNRVGAIEVIRDITAWKKAEETAKWAGAYNRRLIEASLDPLVTINPDGSISDVNEAAVRITGVPREVLIGTDFSSYFTEPVKAKAGYEQVFRDGSVTDYELGIRHKDGRVIPVLYNATIFRDGTGSVAGVFAAARDITEQKKADLALRRSEHNLFHAQKIGHLGNWEWNIAADTMIWSEEIYHIFGVDRNFDLNFENIESRIHPDDQEQNRRVVQKFLSSGSEMENEFRIIRPDGQERFIYQKAEIERDSEGRPLTAFGIMQDISDRKHVESALIESEKKYRFLIENVQDVIWQTTPDLHFTYLSPSVQKITGYSSGELIGKSLCSIITEQSVKTVKKRLEDRKQKVDPENKDLATVFEIEMLRKGGGIVWMEVSSSLVIGSDGTYIGFHGSSRDITERKRAEEALRDSQNRSAMLLEALPDMMFIISRDGVYRDFSVPDSNVLAVPVDQIIGTNIRDSGFKKESTDAILHYIGLTLDTKKLHQFEYELVVPNGRHYYEARMVALSEDSVLGIVRDITDRKQAEEKLRESETRFKDLFNNMSAGVAVYRVADNGEDFIFNDINLAVEIIEKVRKDTIIGKSVLSVFPGVKEFGLFEVMQRVALTGISESFPVSLYKDNRITGWRENYIYKLPSGEVVAIYEDVTEKKQAEEKLRESEENYHHLYDSMRDAFASVGMGGRFTLFNESFQKMVGYEKEEIYKLTYNDLTPV